MNSVRKVALAVTLSATVIAACSDSGRIVGPNAPRAFPGATLNVMGECTTLSNLEALAAPLFGAGTPNANSVLGKLDNLAKKVAAGNMVDAQDQANNIVRFVRDKAAQGQLLGTQAQITEFISGVLCFAGLSPDTYLILPSDDPQVRVSNEGTSGIALEGNTVNEPTLLTLTTLDANGPSPLITKLDQYPSYISITASSNLTKPAVVAVCPLGEIPADVRARLRLGHQATAGFEITPPADASFLPCGTQAPAAALRSWATRIASLFTPKLLYAAMEGGGVGGSVTEFSPFGAVDEELGFSGGGVGGSTTEFLKVQPSDLKKVRISAAPSGAANSVGPSASPGITAIPGGGISISDACTAVSATVGTALSAACQPSITITTHNGTIMEGVPVAWAVESGGGTIAPNTDSCGAFGQTASTTSDATGRVGICWTLGPEGGTNTATAIPSAGGDAPEGVTFKPARLRFTATALKITPTASATGGSFVFDDAEHAGSGSCSNDLTPVLSYAGGAVPKGVGAYTLTVTCGEGSNVYNTVTATAIISIAMAVPSVSVTCPTSVVYDGTAQTPCTATATAPGLSLTPTPAYASNTDVGTATASVALEASGNYAAASGSATFAVTPAPTTTVVSCPASKTFTGAAIEPCTSSTTGPVNGAAATIATPTIVYTNNVNAGSAGASAAYLAGGNYLGSDGSASFTIDPAGSTSTVTCPASVTFTGGALTPCTALVTGVGGLNEAVAVTHTDNVDAGTGHASATYAGGGDYLGSGGTGSFTIDKAPTLVAVTCPSSVAYSASGQSPCTAAVTGNALTAAVDVTYVATSPRDAGTYAASAGYTGGANWLGSTGSASFNITRLSATATAGGATINFGAAVPTIPCSVSGLLSADAGSVTCTTSVPAITLAGSYTTTPVVSPSSPVNYEVTKVNGMLTVLGYTQVNCFSTPIYSVMPPTKSAQRKGSNLPVKCGLTTPQGAPVSNATGNLVVADRGTNGLGAPVTVFSATNVFKYSTGGNYAYGLDTSPAGFVAGHYYYVTATWNDGSTSKGWFLLK